jgi:hypothetical protein
VRYVDFEDIKLMMNLTSITNIAYHLTSLRIKKKIIFHFVKFDVKKMT